jgi:uncharacterized protein YciI
MKVLTLPLLAVAFAAGYTIAQNGQTTQQSQSTSQSSQGTASSSSSASSSARAGGQQAASAANRGGAGQTAAGQGQAAKWKIARPTHAVFYAPNPVGAGNSATTISPSLWEDQKKYYELLGKQGKLLYAGPWRDGNGAMIILNCESDQEAQGIADEDPVVKSLLYVGNIRAWNVTYIGPWVAVPDRSEQVGQATTATNRAGGGNR